MADDGSIVQTAEDESLFQEKEKNEMVFEKAASAANLCSNSLVHHEPSSNKNITESSPADGGCRAWIVCLVSFWTNGTLFGTMNTFGLLYTSLVEEFGKKDDTISFKASWIGSLQLSCLMLFSPIAGLMTNRLGIRPTAFIGAAVSSLGMLSSSFVEKLELMYLTYGFMVGFGGSLLYNTSTVILGHYFKKKLGLVSGIVTFGSAAATIFLPFLISSAINGLGWRWAVRLQTVHFVTLFVGCLIWKPVALLDKHRKDHKEVQPRDCVCCKNRCFSCDCNIWKNKRYTIWATGSGISYFGYYVPFTHLVRYTRNTFPGSNPEILLMCYGISTGIARIIGGKIADLPFVSRIQMQQISLVLLGLSTASIPFVTYFWMLAGLILVMGASDGAFICVIGPITFDLLGTEAAAQGLGYLLGLMAAPLTTGPPVAGLMYDKMGSYNVAFALAGMLQLVASLLFFLIPYKTQADFDTTVNKPLEETNLKDDRRTELPSLKCFIDHNIDFIVQHRTSSLPLLPDSKDFENSCSTKTMFHSSVNI